MPLLIGISAIVATMLLIGALPSLIFDRPRIRRRRQYFLSAGCQNVEIKSWPNHYRNKGARVHIHLKQIRTLTPFLHLSRPVQPRHVP